MCDTRFMTFWIYFEIGVKINMILSVVLLMGINGSLYIASQTDYHLPTWLAWPWRAIHQFRHMKQGLLLTERSRIVLYDLFHLQIRAVGCLVVDWLKVLFGAHCTQKWRAEYGHVGTVSYFNVKKSKPNLWFWNPILY